MKCFLANFMHAIIFYSRESLMGKGGIVSIYRDHTAIAWVGLGYHPINLFFQFRFLYVAVHWNNTVENYVCMCHPWYYSKVMNTKLGVDLLDMFGNPHTDIICCGTFCEIGRAHV